MANLIITVISIALVAVAALMGAYYGGTAFIDGQAKAQANQLVEAGRQISAAWDLYAIDNGGSYVLTDADWNDNTATDLVPKYLSTFPQFSFTSGIHIIKLLGDGTFIHNAADSNFIEFGNVTQKVCEQANLIATGSTAILGSPSTATIFNSTKTFLCTSSGHPNYYLRYRAH